MGTVSFVRSSRAERRFVASLDDPAAQPPRSTMQEKTLRLSPAGLRRVRALLTDLEVELQRLTSEGKGDYYGFTLAFAPIELGEDEG